MAFEEHLQQLIALLQQEGRITYRALKRRLNVEDDYLADLAAEVIDAKRLAVDEDGRYLFGRVLSRQFKVLSSLLFCKLQAPNSKLPTLQTLDFGRWTPDGLWQNAAN